MLALKKKKVDHPHPKTDTLSKERVCEASGVPIRNSSTAAAPQKVREGHETDSFLKVSEGTDLTDISIPEFQSSNFRNAGK